MKYRVPSVPAVIAVGLTMLLGRGNWLVTPDVVVLQILLFVKLYWVDHSMLPGPLVRPSAPAMNWVMTPAGVMLAIPPPGPCSVNQTFPSGPAVTSQVPDARARGSGNSVTTPAGVILPMAPSWQNHTLPSPPAPIPDTTRSDTGNSLMVAVSAWAAVGAPDSDSGGDGGAYG